jgi:hypothetical protein
VRRDRSPSSLRAAFLPPRTQRRHLCRNLDAGQAAIAGGSDLIADKTQRGKTALEILYYTAIAIGLYAVSDAILNYIERARGARFAHRDVVFFIIILVLALITFQVMRTLHTPGT